MSEDLGLRGAHVAAARMLADREQVKKPAAVAPPEAAAAAPAQIVPSRDYVALLMTSVLASVSAVVISHFVVKKLRLN